MCRAISKAYRKPEHAAEMSIAAALCAPIWLWMRQAVAGKNMSGDAVAQRIRSTSAAKTPACSSAARAAAAPRSLVCSPSPAIRRSLMPVRDVIHSSLVSTIFSISAFVMTRAGR